ncbi:MAG: hypothetical protein PWR13_1209 [Archaeoglobi archaeon]|nr:hypothetical protein [Archaeoglobi archaeon]MDK2782181.1 hypothetical protein [Archaeoglobi archaeon]
MDAEVKIRAEIKRTEVEERVRRAILNIFPDAEIRREGNFLIGHANSLETLRELVHRQRIIDTVRSELLKNLRGNSTFLKLRKQVAYVGRLNLSEDDPLGEIEVEIFSNDIESLIWWIAPRTEDGRVVE